MTNATETMVSTNAPIVKPTPIIHGRVPVAVVADRRLTAADTRLYAALASYADKDRVCWPTTDELATRAGMSRRAATGALRHLEAAGWVETTRIGRRATRYLPESHGRVALIPLSVLAAKIPAGAVRTWLAFAAHANRERTCWPSLDTIAAYVGLDMRTVKRHVARLSSEGFLERVGCGRASVLTSVNGAWAAAPVHSVSPQSGHPVSPRSGHSLSPKQTNGNRPGEQTKSEQTFIDQVQRIVSETAASDSARGDSEEMDQLDADLDAIFGPSQPEATVDQEPATEPIHEHPEPPTVEPVNQKALARSTRLEGDLEADVTRVLHTLADHFEHIGCKKEARRMRTAAEKRGAWQSRDDIRLMIRADEITVDQILGCIRWLQGSGRDNTFWRGNVLSSTKLRARFSQMRLQAERSDPSAAGDRWRAIAARL